MMHQKVKLIYTVLLREYGPYESPVSIHFRPGGLGLVIYTNTDRAKRELKELIGE